MKICAAILGLLCTLCSLFAQPDPLPNLHDIHQDLKIPPVSETAPSPGKRVWQTAPGWENTGAGHLLYLPEDWRPGQSWPVIVEYPGNGGYSDPNGDTSNGLPDGCRLGYGASAGRGYLWLSLPYLEKSGNQFSPALRWWGDLDATERYCRAALQDAVIRFGGDSDCVILAGFSRGSIGCHFFGLRNDALSSLWRGFICHSHFDGVRQGWPYAGADRPSALLRLHRLQGRPVFISHEGSTAPARQWLESTGIPGNWTFVDLPFRNHTNSWVLCDIPARQQLRAWLKRVSEKK